MITYKQIDKVCEVQVSDKKKLSEYEYYSTYKEKRIFRMPLIHHDVFVVTYCYDSYTDSTVFTKEDLLNIKLEEGISRYLLEENIVYARPFVYIKFGTDNITSFIKYFETFEEAQEWAKNFVFDNHLDKKLIKM